MGIFTFVAINCLAREIQGSQSFIQGMEAALNPKGEGGGDLFSTLGSLMFKKSYSFSSIIFFLVGTAFLYSTVLGTSQLTNNLLMGYQSQGWGSINGKVTHAFVKPTGGKNPDYIPKVGYEYVVERKVYTGDNIAFKPVGHSRKDAENIVAKYSSGAQVKVFYNPSSPNISCLEPGLLIWENLLLLPLLVMCGGFGILFISLLFYGKH